MLDPSPIPILQLRNMSFEMTFNVLVFLIALFDYTGIQGEKGQKCLLTAWKLATEAKISPKAC